MCVQSTPFQKPRSSRHSFCALSLAECKLLTQKHPALCSMKVKVKVAQVCPSLFDPWITQSMEFSRLEYWSGELLPSPEDLPNPRIELRSLHCRQILYNLSHQGSPRTLEWVAYSFSSGSSGPRNRTGVSCIAGGFFTS